ncbi:F-box protein [Streptomyces erythrochromogenes]|uniref:F-box protein n=1 Tax=Streptomyces erythrochromogenes TaxID=285574 RepID=UPI0034320DC3
MESDNTLEHHHAWPELPHEMWDEVQSCLSLSDFLHLSQVNHALHSQLHKVEVQTQEQLDAALTMPDLNLILVTGDDLQLTAEPVGGAWIITTAPITVMAGRIHVRERVRVTASGTAHVTAHNQATVLAYYQARVTAHDQAEVRVDGRAQVVAHDDCQVWACGEAEVIAYGRTGVTTWAHTRVTAHDQATVVATGRTVVTAHGQAQVTAHDDCQVWAYDQAIVTTHNRATVTDHR